VQANAYSADNRCMLDADQVLGPASTSAVAGPDATAGCLTTRADEGVCSIRLHLLPSGYLTLDDLDGVAARSTDLGCHVQLRMDGRDLPLILPRLERLPCPLVIDDIGKFLELVTVGHPGS
jgi:predicted TIM-barrel fold metal-dependent hydrolase